MPIKSFISKDLEALFHTGKARRINPNLHKRTTRLLDALEAAGKLNDLDVAGVQWHRLEGRMEGRTAIKVNGPWRITFRWFDGNAYEVDLEQYH